MARHLRIGSGAVDHAIDQPRARAGRAARAPENLDGIVYQAGLFESARVYFERAEPCQGLHCAIRARGDAVPMDVPERTDMAQKPAALLVIQLPPRVRQLPARQRQHLAPVATRSNHLCGLCAQRMDERANRSSGRAQRGLYVGLDRGRGV